MQVQVKCTEIQIHPQPESYKCKSNWDKKLQTKEGLETLSFDYKRTHELDIKVARIFNTYGPRMLPNDGRVVSNLIMQVKNENMTLYDGKQTVLFLLDDLVNGLIKLMNSNINGQ